ncbi:MAG TPA: tetratricopeptide repeat protein [Vicinamibacteria bacterium]|nr:tetratricopeptide repeat protein [Vicinamibacteria bacterium]
MTLWRTVLALVVAPSLAAAQTPPEEQARRLLEDGRTYRREGKAKQAVDNFQTIISGFPNTPYVDDAFLEMGRYYMEVDGDAAKAREAFEQVTKGFPQSDGAPGAYYYLGRLTLERSSSAAEIDDALAQFARVQRLYPRSEWVARALYATAQAHRKSGRLSEAAEAARRVALEHPASDAAPAAQFELAQHMALSGEFRQAMEEYQQVRNRFPDSEWSPRALGRITALYRLHGSGRPVFTVDPAFSVGAGDTLKDVRGILMTPEGTLWVASEKVKSTIPFGADGKMGPGLAAENLQGLTLSPGGELVVAAARAVRFGPRNLQTFAVPGSKPGETEPLEKIEAAAVTRSGAILVSDEKKKNVFRFDGQYRYQAPFPDVKERRVSRIVLDGEGAIVMLDREEKTVRAFDESGRVLRTIARSGPGYDMRRPVDVAVDSFRNTYVVDEDGAAVFVFSPQGQLLATVGAPDLKKPRAVTLDASGAVFVYDDKLQRILRFK